MSSPETLFGENTQSYGDEYVMYELRGEDRMQILFIASSLQLVFAALLSGGFADKEELYRAFSEREMPEEDPPPEAWRPEDEEAVQQYIAERYSWEARLTAGYCRIQYELVNSSIENFPLGSGESNVVAQSSRMYITVYESEAQYKKIIQEALERQEALQNADAEASN